jgi:hypothetical protein
MNIIEHNHRKLLQQRILIQLLHHGPISHQHNPRILINRRVKPHVMCDFPMMQSHLVTDSFGDGNCRDLSGQGDADLLRFGQQGGGGVAGLDEELRDFFIDGNIYVWFFLNLSMLLLGLCRAFISRKGSISLNLILVITVFDYWKAHYQMESISQAKFN